MTPSNSVETNNKGLLNNLNGRVIMQLFSDNRKLILVIGLGFAIFGGLYGYMKSDVYEVQAQVRITENDTKSDFLRSTGLADMFGGKVSTDEEAGVMMSYTIYNHIVREYGTNVTYRLKKNLFKRIYKYDDSPVAVKYPPMLADTLRRPIRFKLNVRSDGEVSIKAEVRAFMTMSEMTAKQLPATFTTPYGTFVFTPTEYYEKGKPLNMNIVVSSYASATESLQREIAVEIPSKKASLVNVTMRSTSVPHAEKLVNAVVDGYNARGIVSSRDRNSITYDFITQRLAEISCELDSSERKVEDFKSTNNLTDLVTDATYIFTKKGTIDEELVKAETEAEILQMTRDLMNDPTHRYDLIPTPYGAEAATEITKEYNKLVLERIRLLNNAVSNNNVALRTLTTQIDAMRDNINATLDRSLASAKVKLHDLRQQMHESDSRLGQMPRQEREYLNVKRQQTIKEKIYLILLQQLEETNLRMANAIPKGDVIDAAHPLEGKVNMSMPKLVVIFFCFGIFCALVFCYMRRYVLARIGARTGAADLLTYPIVGEVAGVHAGYDSLVPGAEPTIANVASRMRFMLPEPSGGTIEITGMGRRAHKAWLAANVASSLASEGKPTVIVDLDFDHPELEEILRINPRHTMAQWLLGEVSDPALLVVPVGGHPQLSAIACGVELPGSYKILSSPSIARLIASLRSQFDYVVVNVPALSAANGGEIVAEALVVVCDPRVSLSVVEGRLEAISNVSPDVRIGIVVNGVKTTR